MPKGEHLLKLPDGMTKDERDKQIFEAIFNGAPSDEVAKRFGISRSHVNSIYRTKWKEHCSMASYEAVRKSIGKDRLVQTGPSTYRGEWHRPDGKVKTKTWTMDRPDAEENWMAWREECEVDWEERHNVPDSDDPVVSIVLDNPVRAALVDEPEPEPEYEPEPTTTWSGPAVTTVSTNKPVDKFVAPKMYLLHRIDWKGTPTLFHDCDKALSIAANLAKVSGCEFDVLEVEFWEGE